MMTLLILFSFLINSNNLPEVNIDEIEVSKSLDIYMDSLSNYNKSHQMHLILRKEKQKRKCIIYISEAPSIQWFQGNIPDGFARYKGNYVFLFDSTLNVNTETSYHEFVTQFRKSFNAVPQKTLAEQNESQSTRILLLEFSNTKLKKLKWAQMFPDKKFYTSGLRFNRDQLVTYSDGSYHDSSIEHFQFSENESLDPFLSLKKEIKKRMNYKCDISALITINKNGEVIDAELLIDNCNLLEEQQKELIKLILESKEWEVGLINSKPVCYKQLIDL